MGLIRYNPARADLIRATRTIGANPCNYLSDLQVRATNVRSADDGVLREAA